MVATVDDLELQRRQQWKKRASACLESSAENENVIRGPPPEPVLLLEETIALRAEVKAVATHPAVESELQVGSDQRGSMIRVSSSETLPPDHETQEEQLASLEGMDPLRQVDVQPQEREALPATTDLQKQYPGKDGHLSDISVL